MSVMFTYTTMAAGHRKGKKTSGSVLGLAEQEFIFPQQLSQCCALHWWLEMC